MILTFSPYFFKFNLHRRSLIIVIIWFLSERTEYNVWPTQNIYKKQEALGPLWWPEYHGSHFPNLISRLHEILNISTVETFLRYQVICSKAWNSYRNIKIERMHEFVYEICKIICRCSKSLIFLSTYHRSVSMHLLKCHFKKKRFWKIWLNLKIYSVAIHTVLWLYEIYTFIS
jgi:hypothetical protein